MKSNRFTSGKEGYIMNIVIINGSPRKNGATAKILHEIEHCLEKFDDASVEYVNIGDLNIEPCRGCCACYKTGSCFIKDDAEELSKKIESSDGLVIGSPTYASNVSGQLKQFIDRGHFVIEQLLYGKYAISVATGENYGSADTQKILSKLTKYSGAKLSGKITYNLPFNSNLNEIKALTIKCEKLSLKLYKDIKFHRKHILQSLFHKIIFNVGIKPFVLKKGDLYKGVLSRWKRFQII